MKKKMSKKTKSILAALSVVVVIGVSGMIAYLTDKDQEANKFTVGNVDINLVEPNWNAVDADEDGVPDAAEDLSAGQTLTKDPKVNNEGINPAYVYMKVKVPVANIATANADGTKNAAARTQLFTYTVPANSKWKIMDAYTDTTSAGYNTYVYYYNEEVPSNGSTDPLFESVTFANIIKSSDVEAAQQIDLEAYGIQSNGLPSGTTIPQAYTMYLNQNS